MTKKIVFENEETKKVTTKKPAVVNRVTSRKALGSSPITSDNELTNDDFAKSIEEAKKKIVWCESKRGGDRGSTFDVTISKGKTTNKQKWNFVLRNDYVYTFSKQIQVGNFENKLFFKEVQYHGYSITVQDGSGSKKRKKPTSYFKLPVCKETEYIEKFIGDHEMKYDELLELYYIEVEE